MARISQRVCVVHYAKPYKMENLEGLSIRFLDIENMNPIEDKEDNTRGVESAKLNIPSLLMGKVMQVPAIYRVFTYEKVRDGKPEIKVKDIEFLSVIGDKK